jgi:hypothetical protein
MIDECELMEAIVSPLLNGENMGKGSELNDEMKKKLKEIAFVSVRSIIHHLNMGYQIGLVCREFGQMCFEFKHWIRPELDSAKIYESIKGAIRVLGWRLKPDDPDFDERLLTAIRRGHDFGVHKEVRSALHTTPEV